MKASIKRRKRGVENLMKTNRRKRIRMLRKEEFEDETCRRVRKVRVNE